MPVKRYQAQTVQEALRAVREDLGPDALVLSTRMIPAPGPRGWFGARLVQVTAAGDRTEVPETRQRAASTARPAPGAVPMDVDLPAASPRVPGAPAARPSVTGDDDPPPPAAVARPPAARRRTPAGRLTLATLSADVKSLVAQDEGYAPVEVFVGPSGAGKTTTIAKLAAQERARRGQRLGLIAADAYRVGAVEQLRLYSQILGTPLAVARTPYELQTAIETATVPVLVDTAARSVHDETSLDMFRLVSGRPDVRVHLVAGADLPLESLRAVIERFAPARPTRLVLTKLDEAVTLAPLAPLLREHGLKLSYLGTGPRVPEDLELATPRVLAAWMAQYAGAEAAA